MKLKTKKKNRNIFKTSWNFKEKESQNLRKPCRILEKIYKILKKIRRTSGNILWNLKEILWKPYDKTIFEKICGNFLIVTFRYVLSQF